MGRCIIRMNKMNEETESNPFESSALFIIYDNQNDRGITFTTSGRLYLDVDFGNKNFELDLNIMRNFNELCKLIRGSTLKLKSSFKDTYKATELAYELVGEKAPKEPEKDVKSQVDDKLGAGQKMDWPDELHLCMRLREASRMVEEIFPDSHGFSKRYVLKALKSADEFIENQYKE